MLILSLLEANLSNLLILSKIYLHALVSYIMA